MRVLRVIDRLIVGGPTRQVVSLCEELQSQGHPSTLAYGEPAPGELGVQGLLAGRSMASVRIRTLGKPIRLLNEVRALFALVRLIRRTRPQVVHTHKAKAGALGRVAARLCGVPILVHTFHGHVLKGYYPAWLSWILLQIERVLAPMTDRIIVPSESQKRELLEYGIGREEQYEVIAPGVDLARLREACPGRDLRRELGIEEGDKVVGIVGRLAAVKRHEDFLEAARLLAKARPRVFFVIAGEGPRRSRLERLARRSAIRDKVAFLGNRDDLARIYAGCDAVALCSLNEGVPLTLIEAMACGRPVVATQVGGVPDLIQDGVEGLLVPPKHPKALARALERLLSEPRKSAQMGRRGREKAGAYGMDVMTRRVLEVYRRLAAAKGIR